MQRTRLTFPEAVLGLELKSTWLFPLHYKTASQPSVPTELGVRKPGWTPDSATQLLSILVF